MKSLGVIATSAFWVAVGVGILMAHPPVYVPIPLGYVFSAAVLVFLVTGVLAAWWGQ